MQVYRPLTREIRFLLDALGYDQVAQLPAFQDVDMDTAMVLVEQLGSFAAEKILPTNKPGDTQGLKWDPETGAVTTPEGFKELYKEFGENGFVGVAANPEYGGGGVPEMLSVTLAEMISSTNHSWGMCSGLTGGLIRALDQWGSEEQKKNYLEKLISGQWTGTMCLTEPQCGTDLGLITTKAVPDGDAYKLTGTKIWISFGEHDMAENIVHLVLARLPDAPPGIKGISTFIVPKYTLDGRRNGVRCSGLEHKMGIHGSPTCVIDMEDAEGYLVGTPHKGMRVMFTMMNAARLHVGVEGLAGAEISYQTAVAFAKDRKQSRSLDRSKRDESSAADGILVHPDVRRMLLNQKATNEAMRALCMWTGMQIDIEHGHTDEKAREEAGDLAALLTPVVKAYCTERGMQNIGDAMQTCGGAGYTADMSIEQYMRDTRISMIYEGTNHIQALDLVGRKLPMKDGRPVQVYASRVEAFLKETAGDDRMKPYTDKLKEISEIVRGSTTSLLTKAAKDPEEVGAAANNYLKLFALSALTFMWCLQVRKALDDNSAHAKAKLRTADYFIDHVLPEHRTLTALIENGKDTMMAFEESDFESA